MPGNVGQRFLRDTVQSQNRVRGKIGNALARHVVAAPDARKTALLAEAAQPATQRRNETRVEHGRTVAANEFVSRVLCSGCRVLNLGAQGLPFGGVGRRARAQTRYDQLQCREVCAKAVVNFLCQTGALGFASRIDLTGDRLCQRTRRCPRRARGRLCRQRHVADGRLIRYRRRGARVQRVVKRHATSRSLCGRIDEIRHGGKSLREKVPCRNPRGETHIQFNKLYISSQLHAAGIRVVDSEA